MTPLLLIHYFQKRVKEYANSIALSVGDKHYTFKEIENLAYEICREILRVEENVNMPVAVFLDKGFFSVAADLAIWYSGNCYMNLDVKNPSKRIKAIINHIKPSVIITETRFEEKLKNLDVFVINIDRLDSITNCHICKCGQEFCSCERSEISNIESKRDISYLRTQYDKNLKSQPFECVQNVGVQNRKDLESHISKRLNRLIDTDPCCIINTSGSTGIPKGVALSHKNFFDFIHWSLDEFVELRNDVVIGSLSPIVFDIFSFEICLMIMGGRLVVIPESYASFPIKILEILHNNCVNFIFWVPTIMVNIANMNLLDKIDLACLKLVWFAGEVFPTKQFNYWRKYLCEAKFVNMYGPIEITLDCAYFVVEREIKDSDVLPIGKACRNTDILLLDDENNLVEYPFVQGEICVRGSGVALGYYGDFTKTESVFIQNPLNTHYPELIYRTGDIAEYNDFGELVFKGRKDNIIKHFGYRIDLGEIEHSIINVLKIVKNGCVVYNEALKHIVLFYEADCEISNMKFRKAVSSVLPNYMIPNVYKQVVILERNTNGKIDRLFYKNLVKKGL
ncbi:AMP-binding protein [Helicobacter labetoulli]|uniref:AMP-binding protein n=1 Tax=Helicobacter labetoulli TaxID=2315333 RepID=UPI001ABF1336|nr:AMP-binding protein [Helicobacter labetoulli]